MSDNAGSFAALAAPSSRLITCEDPPPLDELEPGDMVICRSDWGIEQYVAEAIEKGVHVRHGDHRYQRERIVSKTAKRRMVLRGFTTLSGVDDEAPGHSEKDAVSYAEDAFAKTWDALTETLDATPVFEDAAQHLPAPWLTFMPFPTLNPAQAQTAPHIANSDRSVIVTAPTGAGKTVIGMMAVLKAILDKGKKAAWLVPQRSLTAELDRELDAWRGQGLKVVALSGETATDTQATKDAHLWVATTEKFEALCRSSSMSETIAEIDTIVVDEIHLLGDPSRGAVLETLLARVGAEKLPVRIVGLSATAANAPDVADWLDADLVPIAWRPTRQTQQMLMLPSDSRDNDQRTRGRVCAQIVSDVSYDNGSTIIFCGTKAKVRAAALAIARSRGVDVSSIDHSDIAAVHRATQEARVGLHYSDWPHKSAAERDFRSHDSDVLVATSTLAAGVNLPARAVIVHDTTIGQSYMEVSMVQQMFGRAGRAGKEPEGWAFLLGDPYEIGHWRKQLEEGYTIRSGLARGLADHLLAEIVQKNIATQADAVAWWENTFAHHEGERVAASLTSTIEGLAKFGFIDSTPGEDAANPLLSATRLGTITSRMMVAVADARNIIAKLRGKDAPQTPSSITKAEDLLVQVVCTSVEALANAQSATGDQAPRVRRILDSRGGTTKMGAARRAPGRTGSDTLTGDLVSQAGMFLTLRSPEAFAAKGGQVLGVNRSLFNAALYDSPRAFAWIAAVGTLRAVPPWASAVALDMGARVTWHRLQPRRGEGRILAACERAVPRTRVNKLVPALAKEARAASAITPSRLASLSAPEGVAQGRLQEVASKTVRLSGGAFSAGTTAFVATGEKTWEPLRAGESVGNRLAVAFHPSGDAAGSLWLEGAAR